MSEATSTQAKQELNGDLERAKRDTAQLAGAARELGREQLEGAKRRAAEKTDRVADALETTAERLESDGDEVIGGYGHSLATMMRRLSGGLRERDIDEFASELATFARRQPAAFLAGSVALGFGVSRFLKASSRREYEADEPPDAAASPQNETSGETWRTEPQVPLGTASDPLTRGLQGNPTHSGGA